MARYYINQKQPKPSRLGHLFSIFILLMAGALIGLMFAVQYINLQLDQAAEQHAMELEVH